VVTEAASHWRISRAALYGAALGALFRFIGIIPGIPEPPGITLHGAYLVGQSIAAGVISAALFSLVAIARNFIARKR
jgi:hypothetical protein